MKVIPDKFINLTTKKSLSLAMMKSRRIDKGVDDYADEDVENTYNELLMHQNEVLQTFEQFTYTYEITGKEQQDITMDLVRMLNVRNCAKAPRQPLKVIIIGSPFSGKSTYAKMVAKTFGCVLVSPDQLVFEESRRNPHVGRLYSDAAKIMN